MKLERVGTLCSRQRIASAAIAGALIAVGAGCETKSFIDPSEVGRYQKTPLVVPILDKLVVGVESDDTGFANARDVSADDLQVTNRDYRVGPNDLLQYNIQDLSGAGTSTQDNKRVSESGKISLPYVGQISVVGMTEAEVEDAIVKAYADAQILPKAIVSVSVVESQNRIYSVSGAVTQAGIYPLQRGDLRLLEALANARGVTSETGVPFIYIIRHKSAGATDTTMPAATPGMPGKDPLAPQGKANPIADHPVYAMSLQDAQPAPAAATPQTPEEARAAAEKLANEIRDSRAAGSSMDPTAAPAMPATAASEDSMRHDRVIQIEGAGTQPAVPGDPSITTIPPTDSSMTPPAAPATAASGSGFEFTAPAEPTDQEIIKVPYAQLKKGELKYNIVLQPQDMIVVPFPTFGTYYMHGHINRTGAYNLPADGMTLKQAVASAGGLDQLAIPTRTDVIRRIDQSHEMFVRVDLERIFTGLEPDIYLKANDTVSVGTNIGAPFAQAIRSAFRITYGFGFLYDRNYAPANQNQ